MIVSEIKTMNEIKYCVDMYYAQNDFSFLNVDKQLAIKNLETCVRRKKFVRILYKDNIIVSWIYANQLTSQHMSESILLQNYYCSVLKGTSAVRSLKLLHNEMISYAKENKYQICMSNGSHLDENNTFAKILERLGWIRRGYVAIYKIDSNP